MRVVDSICLSADRSRFAAFVRRAVSGTNSYETGWYIGQVSGTALRFVADGGELETELHPNGQDGVLPKRTCQWSSNGLWIAYTREVAGEVQLWASRTDGTEDRFLAGRDADVSRFAWSSDSNRIIYSTGLSRALVRGRALQLQREGYHYDTDLYSYSDFMLPRLRGSGGDQFVTTRAVDLATGADLQTIDAGPLLPPLAPSRLMGQLRDLSLTPALRSDRRASAALERTAPLSEIVRVAAVIEGRTVRCTAPQCRGLITSIWWNASGDRVLFWAREGTAFSDNVFYSWSPSDNRIARIASTHDEYLSLCEMTANDQLLCSSENPVRPAHFVVFDLSTGTVREGADLNPEFQNIRQGRFERIEWPTPQFSWSAPGAVLAGVYGERTYGYIIYPPDYDASRSYPVFVDPYVARGFSPFGNEHAVQAYVANGIIVLRLSFPRMNDGAARLGPNAMWTTYSADLNFPHLRIFMDSTLAGIDAAAARASIDRNRIGIGGVSHGTFVPLYALMNYDRFAALSISSKTWGPNVYYHNTARGSQGVAQAFAQAGLSGYREWAINPEGDGANFWERIDIAAHVGEIEAPILMNLSANETPDMLRLIRNLRDHHLPYDAFIYSGETHVKWQPSHLGAIMRRNLDWFRFWLQDTEDTESTKAPQYDRWRRLRGLQCRNPRSLRDYCHVVSTVAPIAH